MLKQLDIPLYVPGVEPCELVLLLSLLEFLVVCFTSIFPLLAWHLFDELQIVFNDHEVREMVE
jgi:hypothetical protein